MLIFNTRVSKNNQFELESKKLLWFMFFKVAQKSFSLSQGEKRERELKFTDAN